MSKTDEDQGLRAALWAIALSGAVLTLAASWLFGVSISVSVGVALGAGIAAFNLWALGRIVRAFINGAGLPWILLAAFKLAGLLMVVALVLKLGITTALPLALGYSALPLGIVFAQLGAARARVAVSSSIQAGIGADSSPKGR